MKVVNKFEVKLIPNTIGHAYQQLKEVDLLIDILKFSDGTLRVKVNNVSDITFTGTLHIKAYAESLDDVMVIAQIKDIVERISQHPLTYILTVTSPIYSRYDRVMLDDSSDSFSAKVFANFINSVGFDIVSLVDCHSSVLINHINNCFDIEQSNCLDSVLSYYKVNNQYYTIAPDKGAVKKNPVADIVFNKVRDLPTGKILGMEIVSNTYPVEQERDSFIVVDDLCEGGGTFLGVAQGFVSHYSRDTNLSLYITHGLLTNNAVSKLMKYYRDIYVYIMKESVYNSLTSEEKQVVKPFILVAA